MRGQLGICSMAGTGPSPRVGEMTQVLFRVHLMPLAAQGHASSLLTLYFLTSIHAIVCQANGKSVPDGVHNPE